MKVLMQSTRIQGMSTHQFFPETEAKRKEGRRQRKAARSIRKAAASTSRKQDKEDNGSSSSSRKEEEGGGGGGEVELMSECLSDLHLEGDREDKHDYDA